MEPYHFFPLLGVLLAFLFALGSATYFAIRQAEISAINDLLHDLTEIEDLATAYWLGEYETPRKRRAAGHRLRGKLHATTIFYTHYRNLIGSKVGKFEEMDGKLFDLCTGLGFQSQSFKPNPEVAVSIIYCCNEFRDLLRSIRKGIYWVH
jgi:hypothetical protein|tara:strand:- start:139 stop:588 length:450 start_codon:yes stop_codon:yes gene_type:complete